MQASCEQVRAALTAGGVSGGDGEVVDVADDGDGDDVAGSDQMLTHDDGDVEIAGSDQIPAHDGGGVCDAQMTLMTWNCNQTTCMMTCCVEVETLWKVTLLLTQWMSTGLLTGMRSMRRKMTNSLR